MPVLFALLFWIIIARSIRHQSQTIDEGFHLVAGYRSWECGNFGINAEHPPQMAEARRELRPVSAGVDPFSNEGIARLPVLSMHAKKAVIARVVRER